MPAPDPRLTDLGCLTGLGWKPFFSQQLSREEAADLLPVRVMAVHRGKIAVAGAGTEALIAPHVPRVATGAPAHPPEYYPTVGDWLLIDPAAQTIVRILERTSLFKRRAAGSDRKLQLIAANVDTLFIVASCNQDFNLARLERYLVLAREVNVTPIIVLTKADLAENPEAMASAAQGLEPDLLVEVVNGKDPLSVARLAQWCGVGQTVALLGSSGVGKSTMINTLRGSDHLATGAVREADGRGRHTTTVRELHRLDRGGWLMDTPGMRELQLSDAAEGLAEVFDDIVLLALDCRFSNCTHGSEPGCAIQPQLAAGMLDPVRYARWRKLMAEEAGESSPSARRRGRGGR